MILRVEDPLQNIIKRSKILKTIEKGDEEPHSQHMAHMKSDYLYQLSKFTVNLVIYVYS